MVSKLKALWSLFKAGEAVADPAKWKARQITTTMLAGLIVAAVQLAKVFGLEIPIDTETATVIAAGLLAVVNTILTITTSKTVGLPSDKQALPELQQTASSKGAQDAMQDIPEAEVGNRGISDDSRAKALEWAKQQRKYEEIDPNSKSGG